MKTFKSKQTILKTIFISVFLLLTYSCSQGDELVSSEEPQNLIEYYKNLELLKLETYALKYVSNKTSNPKVLYKGKSYEKGEGWAKGKKVNVLLPLHFMYGGKFDVTQVHSYNVKYKDGKLKGTFDLSDFDPENNLLEKISGKVVSSAFEEDCKTVRLTGVITNSKNDLNLVGKYVMWTAEDNGIKENGNRTTDMRYGIPEFIALIHDSQGFPEAIFPKHNISSGDIQIKAKKCEEE